MLVGVQITFIPKWWPWLSNKNLTSWTWQQKSKCACWFRKLNPYLPTLNKKHRMRATVQLILIMHCYHWALSMIHKLYWHTPSFMDFALLVSNKKIIFPFCVDSLLKFVINLCWPKTQRAADWSVGATVTKNGKLYNWARCLKKTKTKPKHQYMANCTGVTSSLCEICFT